MRKFLSTDADVKTQAGSVEPEALRGLSTHEAGGLSDRAFVEKYGATEDYAAARAAIEARAKAAGPAWKTLPGGLRVPAGHVLCFCTNPRCAFANFVDKRHAGASCPLCNQGGNKVDYKGDPGGALREATGEELKAHLAWMRKDAERRQTQIALKGLNARNEERLRAGLPAFTPAEYKAECDSAFAEKVAREQRLGAFAAAPPAPPISGLSSKELSEARASVERARFDKPKS